MHSCHGELVVLRIGQSVLREHLTGVNGSALSERRSAKNCTLEVLNALEAWVGDEGQRQPVHVAGDNAQPASADRIGNGTFRRSNG
ncbi:hypothetical protein D3C72_964830 [compost metagenome]